MHEHPPQDSGGYRRKLIEEEAYKGFTLVELIVVIVILAILAAILIPGLLKWIDQAKDKKYELEAREIALAAEGALAKMYAQGAGALDLVTKNGHYLLKAGGSTDLKGFLGEEIGKFTDAAVEVDKIEIYGNPDDSAPGKWGGSATGFEITFKESDNAEITASLLPGSDRWVINKSSGESGEEPEEDPIVLEAREIALAAETAFRSLYASGDVEVAGILCDGSIIVHWNGIGDDQYYQFLEESVYLNEINKYTDIEVVGVGLFNVAGLVANDEYITTWEGSIDDLIKGFYIEFKTTDGKTVCAMFNTCYNNTDGWECEIW